jgi:hypothetical protein
MALNSTGSPVILLWGQVWLFSQRLHSRESREQNSIALNAIIFADRTFFIFYESARKLHY